jgi:hypothetical protein
MVIPSPRADALIKGYDPVPLDHEEEEEHRRILSEAVNNILEGKINPLGSVTLTANSTTTTMTDRRIGPNSVIIFMPTTANAKSEGAPWVSARATTENTCTLNHSSNSALDLAFDYCILG